MRGLLLVDTVHGPLGASGDDDLAGVGGPILGFPEQSSLPRRWRGEDPVRRNGTGGRPPDADLDANESRIAERREDRLDATVSAGAPRVPDANAADVEVDVVV